MKKESCNIKNMKVTKRQNNYRISENVNLQVVRKIELNYHGYQHTQN